MGLTLGLGVVVLVQLPAKMHIKKSSMCALHGLRDQNICLTQQPNVKVNPDLKSFTIIHTVLFVGHSVDYCS